MMITGTLINCAAILLGGIAGLIVGKRFSENVQNTTLQAVNLCILIIGIKIGLQLDNPIVVLGSLALGAVTGEWLDLEGKLERFANRAIQAVSRSKENGQFAKAFVNCSLIYCVGSMAILGSIEEGVSGDPTILVTKAMIDGIATVIFVATMGPGAILAAVSVLLYQGTLTLLAGYISGFFTDAVIQNISATGGVLIMAIALNMLEIIKVRLANLLPAIGYAVLLSLL